MSIIGDFCERKGIIFLEREPDNNMLYHQWIEKIDGKLHVHMAAFLFAPTPEPAYTRMVLIEKQINFFNDKELHVPILTI